LEAKLGAAASAELAPERAATAGLDRQRHLTIELTAERVERDGGSHRFGDVQVDAAAEGLHVDRVHALEGLLANLNRSAETVGLHRSGDVVERHARGKAVHLERALDALDGHRRAD